MFTCKDRRRCTRELRFRTSSFLSAGGILRYLQFFEENTASTRPDPRTSLSRFGGDSIQYSISSLFSESSSVAVKKSVQWDVIKKISSAQLFCRHSLGTICDRRRGCRTSRTTTFSGSHQCSAQSNSGCSACASNSGKEKVASESFFRLPRPWTSSLRRGSLHVLELPS